MALPRAKLTKLLIAELAAVPTGAQEVQGTAILKSKEGRSKEPTSVKKQAAITTPVLGHTHLLWGIDDSTAGSTGYESTYEEGAPRDHYTGHSHPWVRNEDGSITIGEAMGHTHEVAAKSASLAKTVTMPGVSDENAAAAITARETSASKSTRSDEIQHGGLTKAKDQNMSQTPDLAKQLADLTKTNERLTRIAKLSGAHKAHFDTLSADDADAFLAKTSTERDAMLADVAKRNEEANKVVYVSKSTGDVFRAKDDTRLVDMAKRMDEQHVTLEKSRIRKAALETLGGMPGTDDAHDLIIGSLLKSGAKQEEIDAALECLKGMKATSTVGKAPAGANPGTDPVPATGDEAFDALQKGLIAFVKEKGIAEEKAWTDGLDAFTQTEQGAMLKRAYQDSTH